MMGVLTYFRGEARLRLTGAAPESCLNLLANEKIEFWDITRTDELHYEISVLPKSAAQVEALALRAYCTVTLSRRSGFLHDLRRLLRRPVLAFGTALVLFLSFFLQSFVWTVEVQGPETVHDEEILRALEEEGIHFGAWGKDVDYKALRDRLLLRLPELSWVAVNRAGGKLTVFATARRFAASEKSPYPAANVIAVRDAVLTEVTILEGMRLCKVGDTVREGQVLVSAFEDYGLCLRGVCARAEIYGQTWREMTLVSPSVTCEKRYTGREWKQISLLLGRKRINLCGNSGISDANCDKMISVKELALPDCEIPLTIETATYREYELVPVPVQNAKTELTAAFERQTVQEMVAGTITSADYAFSESGGLFILRVQAVCTEMVARLQPVEAVYEGESNE